MRSSECNTLDWCWLLLASTDQASTVLRSGSRYNACALWSVECGVWSVVLECRVPREYVEYCTVEV